MYLIEGTRQFEGGKEKVICKVIIWSVLFSRQLRSLYSHPGVPALGYVNRTTPDLLSSTSFFNVVFSPSWVSTSPPKLSKEMVSPTVTALEAEAAPLVLLPVIASLALSTALLIGFDFFLEGGGAGGSAAGLRLRNSTMIDDGQAICIRYDVGLKCAMLMMLRIALNKKDW